MQQKPYMALKISTIQPITENVCSIALHAMSTIQSEITMTKQGKPKAHSGVIK